MDFEIVSPATLGMGILFIMWNFIIKCKLSVLKMMFQIENTVNV